MSETDELTVGTLHLLLKSEVAHLVELRQAEALRVDQRIEALQTSVDKAEINAEKWRDNANEWRAAMKDRELNFATTADIVNLEKLVAAEKERNDQNQGGKQTAHDNRLDGQKQSSLWIALAGLAVALVGLFLALSASHGALR